MNGKKARKLRKMSIEIADKNKLDNGVVYSRIKKIADKNKKLKV